MSDESLVVEFCGETYPLTPPGVCSFGRRAEIELDDNPFLHRRLGEFSWRGSWWLANVGRSIPIDIHDAVSMSHAVLAPGAAGVLPFATNVIRFQAGGHNYELVARQQLGEAIGADIDIVDGCTATLGHIPLTPSQRSLIVALAEPRLREPSNRDAVLPTNRQAAHRLGWELTKFNRKLDNVCDKLSRQGVRGLHGGIDALATDRRRRLVDFAVSTALVTAAHLDELAGEPPDTTG